MGTPCEAVVWKQAVIDTVLRTWSNTYPLDAEDGWDQLDAYQTATCIQLAEEGINLAGTTVLGTLLYELSNGSTGPDRKRVLTYTDYKNGSRPLVPGDTPLSWEWGLRVARNTRQGRGARFVYRGALARSECVTGSNGIVALKSGYPLGQNRTQYYFAKLNECIFKHSVFNRASELQYPLTYRRVLSFEIGGTIKLQSQTDAQLRKTGVALQYKAIAESAIQKAFLAAYHVQQDYFYYGTDIPNGAARNWIPLVADLLGTLVSLDEYWKSGQDPAFAQQWRPTSALDGNLHIAYGYYAQALAGAQAWVQSVSAQTADPGQSIEGDNVNDIVDELAMIVFNTQRIMVSRFTGTPIPTVAAVV